MHKCNACKEEVPARSNGIACEACERWFHMACFDLKPNKILNNNHLVFMCDNCLDLLKNVWKEKCMDKDTKNESTQTEEPEGLDREEKEVQTVVTAPCEDAVSVTPKVRSETHREEETQTERPQPRPRTTKPGKVKPTTAEMVQKRAPIRIIGDSMVKKTGLHVRCKMSGSKCTSLSGASIRQVRETVEKEAREIEDNSLMILQGGGNGLEYVGVEDTVKEVVNAVKAVEEKGMSVAVVGVLRRPREGMQYETLRKRTNRRIQEEMLRMKMEWMRERKGNVSFIDMDATLQDDRLFARDGVHLNDAGNEKMGRRLCEWVRARSLRMVERPE